MTRPWLHFVGVAGSGMSALAQYHAIRGGRTTGSDRAFDRGLFPSIRSQLEALGIKIVPQDGSAVSSDMDALIASTAVESTIPDVARARELDVPVRHRSELLADYVAASKTIAVSGTSGKSTVTAMLFELLHRTGREPSVLTGGDLRLLQEQGRVGNAWVGEGDLLVIEADESDGSLVRYHPWAGVLLNLQRDHKETHELIEIFQTFRSQTEGPFFVGEDTNLDEFAEPRADSPGNPQPIRFGLQHGALDADGPPASLARIVELGADFSTFYMNWPEDSERARENPLFRLPIPGQHNVCNAAAALAVGFQLGLTPNEMSSALEKFAGVSRRFQCIGSPRGIDVFDDFGHNPKKIEATLRTAKIRCDAAARNGGPKGRILAVFQPHGFRPTAFIRDELVQILQKELRPTDLFWFLDIFYAGGTASRTVSSPEIVEQLQDLGAPVHFAPSREDLVRELHNSARPGDQVLVLGARDPSLTDLAKIISQQLEAGLEG